MQILIRNAISLDFENISLVSRAAYQEYAAILSAEDWQKMEHSLSNVEHTAKIANFFVAEVEKKIVGAIAYYPPGKSNSQFFNSQWASLRLLAVAPNYRGKGIGKLLTEEGIKSAIEDRAAAVGLYTSEAMTVAQKMYSSLGFKRVRELPKMLGLYYWLYVLYLSENQL